MGLFSRTRTDVHQKSGFEITSVDISHDSIRQNNGTYWYSDFATVYFRNTNSYSIEVVLAVKLTDGSSFRTQKMIIDPYESDHEGWRSPANKTIKGVDIYSVERV